MDDLLEPDADIFMYRPYTKRTWYGGNTHCISPSIARAIQSYERIIRKLSRSEEPFRENRSHCCCNQNTRCCFYRKRTQETARFVTFTDACLSTPTLLPGPTAVKSTYSVHSRSKVDVTVSNSRRRESKSPNKKVCPKRIETSAVFKTDSKPSKLCSVSHSRTNHILTSIENECSVKTEEKVDPDENKEVGSRKSTKNININIEVQLKKKKKHKGRTKCKCKKERDAINNNINETRPCCVKCSVPRKCMCVASEPITIIDLQPQKKEKFKFLKFFRLCKEKMSNYQTPNENIFVRTSEPLPVDELDNIVKKVKDDAVKQPPRNSERKRSENEDDISVFKIKDALSNQQTTRRKSNENDHSQKIKSPLNNIEKPQEESRRSSIKSDSEKRRQSQTHSKVTSLQGDGGEKTNGRKSLTEKISVGSSPPNNNPSNQRRRSDLSKSIIKISKESEQLPSNNIPKFQQDASKADQNSDKKRTSIQSKEVNLSHVTNNSLEEDTLQAKHVDSRLVNRQRLSQYSVTDSTSSQETPKESTNQLSERSNRNNKSR